MYPHYAADSRKKWAPLSLPQDPEAWLFHGFERPPKTSEPLLDMRRELAMDWKGSPSLDLIKKWRLHRGIAIEIT